MKRKTRLPSGQQSRLQNVLWHHAGFHSAALHSLFLRYSRYFVSVFAFDLHVLYFPTDSLFVLPFLHGASFLLFIQNFNFPVSCVYDLLTLGSVFLYMYRALRSASQRMDRSYNCLIGNKIIYN